MATLQELWEREKQVIIHGQSLRFRVIKYIILLAVAIGLVRWQGGLTTFLIFLVLAVISLAIHFLFRWKTKAWTQSWGPYKKLPSIK